MSRNYYARIHTDEGDWFGKFTTKANRDDFCEQDGVWVLRNPHTDWRGNTTGLRERIPATITPTTAAEVRRNEDWLSVQTYY